MFSAQAAGARGGGDSQAAAREEKAPPRPSRPRHVVVCPQEAGAESESAVATRHRCPTLDMCHNIFRYSCGHVQRFRAACYKASRRRRRCNAVVDFFFPPAAEPCDDLTGEVFPVKGPCPACAYRRKHPVVSAAGDKPLPRLPAEAETRDAHRCPRPTPARRRSPPPSEARGERGASARGETTRPAAGADPRHVWHLRARSPAVDAARHQPPAHDWLFGPRPAVPSTAPGADWARSPGQCPASRAVAGQADDRTARRAPGTATSHAKHPGPSDERGGIDGAQKSFGARWRIDLLKSRHNRCSVDSDRSWVSPAARRIENGEMEWVPYSNPNGVITSWI